jgi:hypothetical protein
MIEREGASAGMRGGIGFEQVKLQHKKDCPML